MLPLCGAVKCCRMVNTRFDGKNIVYTETLPDGKTRTFPYYVTQFTDKEITFETTDDDGSRVKAIKE